jgi:RsiW-degrading membrane proteinase PrsW (M82 family)
MELLQCLVLGLVPGAFWLWAIRSRDDHEPEPWPLVGVVFALGCASTLGVLWLRPTLEDMLPLGDGLRRCVLDAFLVTAPLEEAMKMLAFVVGIAWHRELDEPLDGIIYGSAAGLGFATVENMLFISQESAAVAQLEVLGIRAFTATLVHVSCSATIGFCLGLLRFTSRGVGVALAVVGFLVAVILHGLYDVFLFEGHDAIWVSLLLVLPVRDPATESSTSSLTRSKRSRMAAIAGVNEA